jgi:hypothetical protein
LRQEVIGVCGHRRCEARSYVVTRSAGELVRVHLNNGRMDITVGLGHWARSGAKGILATPTRTALSMRDGTRLNEPFSANDLYQRYQELAGAAQ